MGGRGGGIILQMLKLGSPPLRIQRILKLSSLEPGVCHSIAYMLHLLPVNLPFHCLFPGSFSCIFLKPLQMLSEMCHKERISLLLLIWCILFNPSGGTLFTVDRVLNIQERHLGEMIQLAHKLNTGIRMKKASVLFCVPIMIHVISVNDQVHGGSGACCWMRCWVCLRESNCQFVFTVG